MSQPIFDIVVLTDDRYVNPSEKNEYITNVLLEDELVRKALSAKGLRVIRKSWSDPEFDWTTTHYGIFRTTWDYFDRYTEFFDWFQQTSKKTRFINTEKLIRWNIDKHYLKDLQQKGVHIPKTYFVEQQTNKSLEAVLEHASQVLGFEQTYFVLKPCIAGGARHTYKFHKTEAALYNEVFQQLIAEEAMLLQEFQKNIVDQGELSLVFFDSEYSHAVLKKAKKGDFRVQDDWGGTVHEHQATAEEIEFAQKVITACFEVPIYARVDIFRDNQNQLALAELEIFEPELWFRNEPKAAHLLATGIKKRFFT